ncbi:uncharacterized protein EV422DRAFT_565555 [Fimicolochytrium jonesii]|uniref:uncharacterized protein n=1 Tax=Fimicolochytrium jonesii TaxID=1396493 RepID=UPI0022FE4260|nr:uncharacterized protein EV422DRAFT_565555 [Fimicolochytrium jonesii]KAI8823619.1 hypothetical protein EV422DRAFT_565555 [Fimicolochytrium jonesii]
MALLATHTQDDITFSLDGLDRSTPSLPGSPRRSPPLPTDAGKNALHRDNGPEIAALLHHLQSTRPPILSPSSGPAKDDGEAGKVNDRRFVLSTKQQHPKSRSSKPLASHVETREPRPKSAPRVRRSSPAARAAKDFARETALQRRQSGTMKIHQRLDNAILDARSSLALETVGRRKKLLEHLLIERTRLVLSEGADLVNLGHIGVKANRRERKPTNKIKDDASKYGKPKQYASMELREDVNNHSSRMIRPLKPSSRKADSPPTVHVRITATNETTGGQGAPSVTSSHTKVLPLETQARDSAEIVAAKILEALRHSLALSSQSQKPQQFARPPSQISATPRSPVLHPQKNKHAPEKHDDIPEPVGEPTSNECNTGGRKVTEEVDDPSIAEEKSPATTHEIITPNDPVNLTPPKPMPRTQMRDTPEWPISNAEDSDDSGSSSESEDGKGHIHDLLYAFVNNVQRSDALAGSFLVAGSRSDQPSGNEQNDDERLTSEQQHACVAYGQRLKTKIFHLMELYNSLCQQMDGFVYAMNLDQKTVL